MKKMLIPTISELGSKIQCQPSWVWVIDGSLGGMAVLHGLHCKSSVSLMNALPSLAQAPSGNTIAWALGFNICTLGDLLFWLSVDETRASSGASTCESLGAEGPEHLS